MAVVYDELYISTMREISVCRKKIGKLRRILDDMERKYQLSTSEFIRKFTEGAMRDHKDYLAWYDSYQGLGNWEERLKGFHEILRKY
jgi:hypothetical protein